MRLLNRQGSCRPSLLDNIDSTQPVGMEGRKCHRVEFEYSFGSTYTVAKNRRVHTFSQHGNSNNTTAA